MFQQIIMRINETKNEEGATFWILSFRDNFLKRKLVDLQKKGVVIRKK